MPREEFLKTEEEWIKGEISTMFYIGELQLYKNSLEARIAELESPKSCDGCEYLSPETNDDYEFCKKDGDCIRWKLHLPDHYKVKEIK
jgi:hypothetical protein